MNNIMKRKWKTQKNKCKIVKVKGGPVRRNDFGILVGGEKRGDNTYLLYMQYFLCDISLIRNTSKGQVSHYI